LLRFGRPLVKDVAGYQMSKLFTGSYGTLGLVTEVTLKLYPLPRASASIAVKVSDLEQGLNLGMEALSYAINCAGITLFSGSLDDTTAPGFTLLYTAEGHFDDVTTELSIVRVALEKLSDDVMFDVVANSATQEWQRRLESIACIRLAVPARNLPDLCSRAGIPGLEQPCLIDITNGCLYLPTQPGQLTSQLSLLQQAADDLDGYAILATGPRAQFQSADAWGKARSAHRLMQRLKLRWDPGNILNRNEFIHY
jgi:D-lactate dehydrogenase (cytochrome)